MKMIVEVRADKETDQMHLEIAFDPILEMDEEEFNKMSFERRHEQNLLVELADIIAKESNFFKTGEGQEPEFVLEDS